MSTAQQEEHKRELERAVLAALDGLRFGSVEITVHDGRVVQIERKEKIRPAKRRFVRMRAAVN